MIPIQTNQLAGLEWRQNSAFSRTFELFSGDSVLARMEWLKTFGTLASAETADASWTFKRTGFLSSVITARVAGTEADIAAYHPNWMGTKGLLESSGQSMELHSSNFWSTEWILRHQEVPLLKFGSHGVFKSAAEVTVTDAGRARKDLPLLLCFVWYILLMHMEDSSSAVIAAT